jgi:quercetin dioxygenase-like cupin family protein
MKVVRMDEVMKEPFENPIFTGSNVTKQVLFPESHDFTANIVNFGKGVRNKFHSHESEQILIVTYGRGIVATESEERIVTKGDIILIPAGEKHRHGASKDSEFSHIFITRGEPKTKQLGD